MDEQSVQGERPSLSPDHTIIISSLSASYFTALPFAFSLCGLNAKTPRIG